MKQDDRFAASWYVTRITLSVLGTQLRNWGRYKWSGSQSMRKEHGL